MDSFFSQQILDLHFPSTYFAHDFFTAEHNEQAYQWVTQWPRWTHQVSVISGPEGAGKTHLGYIWAERSRALFLKTQHFLEYAPYDLADLAHAFIWDTPHFSAIEEPVFHFYNHLIEQKKFLLFLHSQPPYGWPIALPDLKSRLLSVPHIPLSSPQDELLEKILRKLLLDYQIHLSSSVAQYILKRCPRSCHALKKIAQTLAKHLHTTHQNLNIQTARNILEQYS